MRSSGTFIVPGKAPHVTITSDMPSQILSNTKHFLLSALVQDVEEGVSIDRSSILWHSDVDGELGRGRDLVIDPSTLTRGTHHITVTATDKDRMVGTDGFSVELIVNPEGPTN